MSTRSTNRKRMCREHFFGYAVAIERRADPHKLGPFFSAGSSVGHRAFFWKHKYALEHRRDMAAHGFNARIVKVIVSMNELPSTHPWPAK